MVMLLLVIQAGMGTQIAQTVRTLRTDSIHATATASRRMATFPEGMRQRQLPPLPPQSLLLPPLLLSLLLPLLPLLVQLLLPLLANQKRVEW
jgi:hypothetical protein